MKTARREQRIIGLLESRGEISVNELSEILDISVSTLCKQLAVMQQNGLLIRTYGGVMSVNRVPDESFESKLRKNVAEKRKIAERARALVPSGASIALGSGTTVYDLCNLLDDLDRGVIYSNSMQASDYLARVNGLEVHICSGIVRSLVVPEDYMMGYQSVSDLADYIHRNRFLPLVRTIAHRTIHKDTLFAEENQEILFPVQR